jgi:hypothetical protein
MKSLPGTATIVSEAAAALEWREGRDLLASAKLATWQDLLILVSSLAIHCERAVYYYAQALRASTDWFGRSLARIVAEREIRVWYDRYSALLFDLQAFTSRENPPVLAIADTREDFWEKVTAWLERERLYLEGRWLANDVSRADQGAPKR